MSRQHREQFPGTPPGLQPSVLSGIGGDGKAAEDGR
jgi:hypothetical protein